MLDGNPEAVQVALDAGAVLNGPEGSFEAITCRWPLHAAAANNHIEVAKLLVARGADLDKLDAVSEPALWHAVEQGHGRMVEALLEVGATASDLPAPQGAVRVGLGQLGVIPVQAAGLVARDGPGMVFASVGCVWGCLCG